MVVPERCSYRVNLKVTGHQSLYREEYGKYLWEHLHVSSGEQHNAWEDIPLPGM